MLGVRPTSFSQILHAFYINLECRNDRKNHTIEELSKIGILFPLRFNAIKLPNGALGCSLSHLKILELAKKQNLPCIMIFEDDILFLNPDLFINNINDFLKSNNTWDVILFAGNNCRPFTNYSDSAIKVNKCQTTTAYLVNSHYYDTLIQNIKEGINLLLKFPEKHFHYAIDKYWFKLQSKDEWYLIIPPTIIQKIDYSNIEKRMTDYSSAMLKYDK
jgi:glycosyl transferase family 25